MNLIITELDNKILCAWYKDNKLIQASVDNKNNSSFVGSVFLGKVKNIVPNINAVFVDIGIGETCFLQLDTRIGKSPAYIRNGEPVKINREDEIVVQLVREGIKTKQPQVTTNITLAGRYLIKTCKNNVSISSKIKNVNKRKALQSLFGEDTGYIVRTNADSADTELILEEKKYFDNIYNTIYEKATHATAYSCLYHAPTGYELAVRDSYAHEIKKIITDNQTIYDNLKKYMTETGSEILDRLHFYEDSYPLKSLYDIQNKLDEAIKTKVWLDSGSYLIIEPTEACTVIDVNSGKSIAGKDKKENTAFKINLEAAKEVAAQLRLRNISGIIIVDFIDMEDEEHKNQLVTSMREFVAKDPVKTTVVDITKLGLMEITRKKTGKSLYEQLI
ncbi:MAG: ribonuclease E/G [Lachnospiraceae bacterium]|nr:ribonuclease E/G [Lachnospiraceae bacterium]